MRPAELATSKESFLADILTPVGAFQKLRAAYPGALLLESSDYQGEKNSVSYICCDSLASLTIDHGEVRIDHPQKGRRFPRPPLDALKDFYHSFSCPPSTDAFLHCGLFGYMNYDSVNYFEDIKVGTRRAAPEPDPPQAHYSLPRFLLIFDHFRKVCHCVHAYVGEPDEKGFARFMEILRADMPPFAGFRTLGKEMSGVSDSEFMQRISTGIRYTERGDVYQIVFSRDFSQGFSGDVFQVYRHLRSINPSPYLFYFDYPSHTLLGSSPEAQITIEGGKASIYPIAGTFRRSGDDAVDAELARRLLEDPKENSEHTMLVDLARNDLSRHASGVHVASYKQVQYYSHLIHLVSKVTGTLDPGLDMLDVVASTFPAGTLSGAPKYRAMQLIDKNETSPRGYYGGMIGFMGFDGIFNHAIMIRTFQRLGHTLHFRAGMGIVSQSIPERELEEVNQKVGALRKALREASKSRIELK